MGNISQSSKRSALKGFDVYFQHEQKMNKTKEQTPMSKLFNTLEMLGVDFPLNKELFIEEEKELILNSYCDGHRNGNKPHRKVLACDYYKEEFKHK